MIVGNTGVGTYALGGNGSLVVNNNLTLGASGHGHFYQSGNGYAVSGTLILAQNTAGYGYYSFSGADLKRPIR